MATKTEYKDPGGELPIVKCACGYAEFVQHEREPGKRTILECMSCHAFAAVNIKGFHSAFHSLDAGEWEAMDRLAKRNIEPDGSMLSGAKHVVR
jgi:hypothetical protein